MYSFGYYDKNGGKITPDEWVNLLGDPSYKVVKQDTVEGYFISTVWLGSDHRFGGGTPIIFETMVFKDGGGGVCFDIYQERYHTKEAALGGHLEAIEWVKNLLMEGDDEDHRSVEKD